MGIELMLTEKQRKNWNYLVAAVQNPQGDYVNARATRYADAIVAVNKQLQLVENKVYSNLVGSVLNNDRE